MPPHLMDLRKTMAAKDMLRTLPPIEEKSSSYTDLHDAIASVGIEKSVSNLTVTINQGSFFFFLQCAAAIGIKNLRLDEIF